MFIKKLKPLTNYDITNLANELKIKDFRWVYFQVFLEIESGTVNLDRSRNNGTYFVYYCLVSSVDANPSRRYWLGHLRPSLDPQVSWKNLPKIDRFSYVLLLFPYFHFPMLMDELMDVPLVLTE